MGAAKKTPIQDIREHFKKADGTLPSRNLVDLWIKGAGGRKPDGSVDFEDIEEFLAGTNSSYSAARRCNPERKWGHSAVKPAAGDQGELLLQKLAAEVREREAKADLAEMERDQKRRTLVSLDELLPVMGSVIAEHCHHLDANCRTIAGLANPAEPERARREIQRFVNDSIEMLESRMEQAAAKLSQEEQDDFDSRNGDEAISEVGVET